MKRIKIGLPIIAFVLAIAASAFTVKPTFSYFYRFTPDSSTAGLMNEENYVSIGQAPSSTGCSNGDLNCLIELSVAPDANGHPDFQTAGIDDEADLDAVTVYWKQDQ
jgi:hypothetical protein